MQAPVGTCYEDAWRFLIREEEGELIHGTVESRGRRIGHAWVELPTGYIWEPESRQFIKKADFQAMAKPQEEHRYTVEEAAIILARVGKHGPWTEQERQMLKRGNPMPKAVPEVKQPWQMTLAEYKKTLVKPGDRVAWGNHYEYVKQALLDGLAVPPEVLVDYPELRKYEIPKTKVASLGFIELELPVARAVEALTPEDDITRLTWYPWSSGFHGALNQRWTIVFRGKVSDKVVKAAEAAGLEVSYREAPIGSGQFLTDVSLPDVGVTEIEKATETFNRLADLYEGLEGGNPKDSKERLLKVAIEHEPLGVAKQLGYEVHRLSPKDIVDKDDYARGYRYRLSKADPRQPYPQIVMARSEGEVATFLKRQIGGNPEAVPEVKDWGLMGRAYQEEFDKRFFQKATKDLEGKSTDEIASYYAKMVMDERTGYYLREVIARYNLPTDSLKMHQRIIELAKPPAVKAVPEVGDIVTILNPELVNKTLVGKKLKVRQITPEGRIAATFVDKADIKRFGGKYFTFESSEFAKPPAVAEAKLGGNPSRVRFDRASIDSAIVAAKQLKSDKDLYVFATYLGYTIDGRPPPGIQSYVVVHPDGSTETIKPSVGGNPEVVLNRDRRLSKVSYNTAYQAWDVGIFIKEPKYGGGFEYGSRVRRKFFDTKDEARAWVDKFMSLEYGEVPKEASNSSSKGGNPMGKVITKEEAIGMLERLSMTPDEAMRSLFGSEEEGQVIMKAVQERVKREQNKWAPMDPREGPPLPRVFAGLRWPWRK